MFESTLKQIIKDVFDFDKVTYDAPGESLEQECVFVEVENSRSTIKDGQQLARVTGRLRIFANAEKLPYGYFTKKIDEHPDKCRDIFFYDIELNAGYIGNLTERSMSFVYFFTSQYDPNQGTITSIELSEA